MTKAKLIETEEEWNTLHASIEGHLGIPIRGTKRYAVIEQVVEGHADAGKYIMPICMETKWKCDDFVGDDGLVDWDHAWSPQPTGLDE